MEMDDDAAYRVIETRDRRFDGRVSAAELLRHAERWRPWRAYAALHLWASLSCATREVSNDRHAA